MKLSKVLAVIFFALILFCFLIYAYLDDSFPVRQNYASHFVYPDYWSDTHQIEDVAWNISQSHNYISIFYDCTQFSEELVRQLQALNYSAECVSGVYDDNGTMAMHTWVETTIDNEIIPIEATSGFIIGKGTYYGHYQILSKGYCL